MSPTAPGFTQNVFIIFSIFGENPGETKNYYYYTLPHYDISKLVDQAKLDFKVKLTITIQDDNGWGFFKDYPIELFKP